MPCVNSRSMNTLSFISTAFFALRFLASSSVSAFQQASGAWTATRTLNFPRVRHASTLLANGQVLVASGGDTSGNLIISAELYSPATGSVLRPIQQTWARTTGQCYNDFSYGPLVLLCTGKVLLARDPRNLQPTYIGNHSRRSLRSVHELLVVYGLTVTSRASNGDTASEWQGPICGQ